MVERGARDHGLLLAVADAAVVLAPRHLTGIGDEVEAGDPVIDALLGAAETRKEARNYAARSRKAPGPPSIHVPGGAEQ